MAGPAGAAPAPAPLTDLQAHLEATLRAVPWEAAIARDPVRFPRRYPDPRDVEVAGVFAALLAFGRVELFGAALERIFALADRAGGPRAWVEGFDDDEALAPLYYRWFTGSDFALLARTLGAAVRSHGSLAPLFPSGTPAETLEAGIGALRGFAPTTGSRAFATWFPRPSQGSACKRWWMYLRWMVRRDRVDLGVWTHLSPGALQIPVDTHVLRIARLLGLTTRKVADWRTSVEITAALRRFEPDDPVRLDFALAHLGISGACRGRWAPEVCPRCPLVGVCREGRLEAAPS